MRAVDVKPWWGPIEGPEIYGFVGGAWHGLAPLRCHVTAPLDRAPWASSGGARLGRHGRSLGGCTSRREVALFFFCPSRPSPPGLDLTIHLRRLCGIFQRWWWWWHVEDWRCFKRSSCWNWFCFGEFKFRQCLLLAVVRILNGWCHGCQGTTHTPASERLIVSGAPPIWHQHV